MYIQAVNIYSTTIYVIVHLVPSTYTIYDDCFWAETPTKQRMSELGSKTSVKVQPQTSAMPGGRKHLAQALQFSLPVKHKAR